MAVEATNVGVPAGGEETAKRRTEAIRPVGPTLIRDRRKWLLRLIYVRLAVFTLFVAAEVFRRPSSQVDLLVLLAAVYALSACWFALLKLNSSYGWQSYAQIVVDLLLITWTVNRTGGFDSNFSSLYFLSIVMSSILLGRRGVFVAGTARS